MLSWVIQTSDPTNSTQKLVGSFLASLISAPHKDGELVPSIFAIESLDRPLIEEIGCLHVFFRSVLYLWLYQQIKGGSHGFNSPFCRMKFRC